MLRESVFPKGETSVARHVATEDQRLSPLRTTALHGARSDALPGLFCADGKRRSCPGCAERQGYSYVRPVELPGEMGGQEVTTRVLLPVVIAPKDGRACSAPIHLEKGQSIGIRTMLIGERAISRQGLVLTALVSLAPKLEGRLEEPISAYAFPQL